MALITSYLQSSKQPVPFVSGSCNDDLVDNLKQANYIKSRKVEAVFRAVDRADYYLSDHKDAA